MPEVVRNGWTLRAHALFLNQLEAWIVEVEAERARAATTDDPLSYRNRKSFKLMAVVRKLMLTDIPSNPLDARYRHGSTAKIPAHIYRAKFANGRYRLFYQAKSENLRIIYMWVNNEDTLRAYESKTDAYAVFAKLLKRKALPPKWDDLNRAVGEAETARLAGVVGRTPEG